jgi:signal transduction histidine kinase
MNNRIDPLGEAGLQFYSKVSASISHEIKNSLAVINESAGFLEDLTLMAQKGRPLDMGRLQSLAETMLKQVQRSNGIVKNMNRLAHSLDEDRVSVGVNSLIEFMLNLSERTTVTRGVKVTSELPDVEVYVTTNAFFLENLIWLLLESGMNACGTEKSIELKVSKRESGARITFSGLENPGSNSAGGFPSEIQELLISALGAEICVFENKGRIELNLPEYINQSVGEYDLKHDL